MLQRLEVQTNRRDRSLQFVGDGIDEAVVLLIAPNFPDEEKSVQDKTSRDSPKKNDSQGNLQAFAPVENNPSKTNCNSNGRKEHAERQEEENRLATARYLHAIILQAAKENDTPAPGMAEAANNWKPTETRCDRVVSRI